jgi:hypothetical protein
MQTVHGRAHVSIHDNDGNIVGMFANGQWAGVL